MMLIKKNRVSKYTVRLSSARISPTNSITDIEWNNEKVHSPKNKTNSRFSSKKARYACVAITCAIMIAIIIVIAVVVPSATKSKSTTTQSTISTSSITTILNISVTSTNVASATSSTISVTTVASPSTATSTGSVITTIIGGTGTSTTSETTTTTESTSTSTTSETTTTTASTSTSTTSETTTTTASTSTSTTSETTTTTESTSTSTTSETTTTTTTTSTTMFPLRWNKTGITVAGDPNFSNATADYLKAPKGMVFDSSDTLYLADTDHHRAQQFLLGSTSGTTIAGNASGLSGSGTNFLTFPNDVAIDSNRNLYVTDTFNNRIRLWRVNATSGVTIGGTGSAGSSTAQLDSPRGIAYDFNTDSFYVSDTNNNRIMKYTLNSTVGVLVAGGNGPGLNSTQLNAPRGLYFDSITNSLIIANNAANNIVRWPIGASSWSLVAGDINGVSGSSSTLLNAPWDVILDFMGNVYVTDTNNHRVQFFRVGELNATTIAGVTGSTGSIATKLYQPYSLAFDSQLNLYVSDTNNNRIQKFLRY